LTECKRICGHGNWLPWLEQEFGWTDKTAENFINVYKLASKFENFSNLDLPLSGLYLLAAPSTPESAKTEVIERATAGEAFPVAKVKRTVERHKGRKQPATKVKSKEAPGAAGAGAHKKTAPVTLSEAQRELEAAQAHIDELETAREHDREKLHEAERIIRALESEVGDLKRENADLRAQLEAAKAKPLDAPAPKKRGRPKGSKNKPRPPVAATVVTRLLATTPARSPNASDVIGCRHDSSSPLTRGADSCRCRRAYPPARQAGRALDARSERR
jgi:hypothetical protein